MICNSSFKVPSYAKLLGRAQQQPLSKFRGQQPLTLVMKEPLFSLTK